METNKTQISIMLNLSATLKDVLIINNFFREAAQLSNLVHQMQGKMDIHIQREEKLDKLGKEMIKQLENMNKFV